MGLYESRIGPRVISWSCGSRDFRPLREAVVSSAAGDVLEVGIGSGHNLRYYASDRVKGLWGLEPSAVMRKLATKNQRNSTTDIRWLDLPGEQIPLDDQSVDTVVSTFTLCSIPDVQRALVEMRRVLRPGGRFLFLEHGLDPDEAVRSWQRRIEPTWKKLGLGCHLTRPIDELILGAGLRIQALETGYIRRAKYLPKFIKACGIYGYWGSAVA